MKNFNLLTLAVAITLVAACSSAPVEKEPAPVVAPIAKAKPIVNEPAPAVIPEPIVEIVQEEVVPEKEPEPVIIEAVSDIEYTCEHGGSERIIRVFNDTAEGLACEVTYEKSSGTQTLWTANNDKEYCAQRAATFASKQVGWGWNCVGKDGTLVSAPVAPVAPVEVEAPVIEPTVTETPAEPEAVAPETVETETVVPEATETETETEVLIKES